MFNIKKIIIIFLSLILISVCNIPFINAANELSPTELLGNPGFEGTYTIVASSWQNISSNIAINCSKDTNNPHGGSASQKISIPVASNFVTNAAMFGQKFTPFKGATTYEGSVWLKSSDGATVRFSLLAEGNWTDPGAVQLVKLTPTWTKYTIRGGWDTNKIGYFGFYFISSGTVWMDDASLREVINDDNVVTQNTIPETFFGMHVTHCFDPRPSYRYNTWPANLQFKYLRLWDTLVTWMDIEPTKGNWNWTTFDLYVSTAVQYNKEIIYTLGRIPAWASSKPTDPKPTIAAPQNIGDWRNYVRTVATRYKGKIKYWEMWNETNTLNFYTGTTEKMLEMTIAAREELKAVDPNNVILSPNVVNGDEWLDKVFYLGGGQYVDIISIHRYSSFKPELEQPYYAAVKNVMEHHGIGNKPVWDTEGATWGTPPSAADAVGALARMYILRWAWGFSNFCWYGWDLDVGNPLSQPNHIQPTASGIAYDEVVKWLQGNQMMNIQHDTNGTWIVDIKQADGTLSYIVWNQNGTQVFNIPANWSIQKKKDLDGLASSVSPGTSITIGVMPVLLAVGTDAIQDTIAPAQITSLGIVNVASTGVTLSWTAVGDDGTTGTASSYDIRYATYNVNAGNWNTLTQYTSEPDPKVSGSNESLTINGLLSDTTYYFGIKSWDDVLNLSDISNIISRKTSAITQFKGQWHLDEGTGTIAQDTSGNNNIGTLTNGPIWVDGKSGKAVKFDGVNDNISVPNSASLNMGTQDFTITAWANFDELTTARHGIIAKITGDPTNGPAMGYGYMIHVHNNKYLRFSVTGGVNIYRFAQYALTGANVTGWHFVTGTWNAATNTAKLYLDGLEVASNSYASGTVGNIDNTNNLVIGSTYKGILDEVYIWNRALSANEVLAEYNPGLTDITAPQSINNLNITNLSSNTVTLSWTAVGDDGTTGTAASYDIRYYTATITSSNWGSAVQCTNEPAPKIAGNNENFIINNLIPNTTYYFAIKVADEIPNTSGISNISSGKTLAIVDPVPAGELLTNPGFEGTYSVGIAPGWGPYTYGVTCSQDTNNPHGGSVSQKISVPVLSTTTGVYFRQSYVFKPGTVYEGSVWLKSSDGAVVRLGLEKSTQWYELGAVKTIQLTPTWTKYTIRGGWNLDVSTGSIGIRFISAGTVWMDDASLSEVNTNIVSTQNTIPGNFFGMHICHWDDYKYKVWPEFLQFKTMRLWDTRTDWRDVEPTNNNWNWSRLDLVVSTAVKFNCDLIYNFGRTPTWAASDWKLPPANIADWRNYVNTIATRYKGKIKYWEIWNEVNTGGFYTGTVEQMVEMTRVASEELKAVDSTNIILSPNITRVYGIEWLDKFLNLGGGQYVDVISFHLYDDNLYKPELDRPLVAAVKSLMDNYGVGNKPLWNTEGATGTPPTTDDAAGSLARMYILQWSWGINVFCWYGWDLDVGNPLSQPGYIQPTAAGTAYPEVVKWLRGNQMMNINKDTNGTWIVDIKNVDNSLSYIVWNQNGNRSFNIPGNWSVQTKKDLAGFSVSALPGSSISIGVSPVLLGVNTPIQDTTAPAQINTLTANSSDTNSITLNWTAVGDDGTTGTATICDIRYQTYTITTNNFAGATQCSGEPTPKEAGNNENFLINNLTPDTTYYFAIKARDEIPNWSGISNIVVGKTLKDTTAPAQITSLVTSNFTTTSITLRWTSVGDDGTTGAAIVYDIRYSTYNISAVNWNTVTQVNEGFSPQNSGHNESYTVTGLTNNTTYYFGIKTRDEIPNWSALSNIVQGKTSALTDDMIPPAQITTLTTNNSTTNSIILNWTSVGDDGTTGTAMTYDIRYATYSITSSNFSGAFQCNGEPIPQVSENSEAFTINNLTTNTTYYFAIKVGDEIPNWSGISNIAIGKTIMEVMPDTTSPNAITNLAVATTSTNTITISW